MLTWTPLHRELGLSPRVLTYADFQAAVAAKLTESADLEWKVLPPDEPHKFDIAYDIAAMANSGGGLICIGVREVKASSAAKSLEPVSITDQARRNLWQTVAAVVRPRIAAFELVGIPAEPGGDEGIIAIIVRASSSAPHLIERSGQPDMRAPIRQGASTAYMTEAELGRAYSRRFDAGQSVVARHGELVEDAGNRVEDVGAFPWLFATAVPLEPLPVDLRPGLNLDERNLLAQRAYHWSVRVLGYRPGRRPIISRLQVEPLNQVRGPRGWFTRQGKVPGDKGKSKDTYLMIYDDGSTGFGVRANLKVPEAEMWPKISEPEFISNFDIESLAADFFCVLDAHSRAVGGAGPLSVRFAAWQSTNAESLTLVEPDQFSGGGLYERVDESLQIYKLREVRLDYEPDTGEWNRRRAALDVSSDLLTQFGVAGPFLFRDEDPGSQSTLEVDKSEQVDESAQ